MKCEHCTHEVKRLVIHDRELWCTACHDATKGEVNAASGVIGDDIPGGVEIKNGLCNPDGSPRRYYSKTELRQEAAKRGLVNHVTHVPKPGTDKSPYTTRWI